MAYALIKKKKEGIPEDPPPLSWKSGPEKKANPYYAFSSWAKKWPENKANLKLFKVVCEEEVNGKKKATFNMHFQVEALNPRGVMLKPESSGGFRHTSSC
jgi:hypothetical protein